MARDAAGNESTATATLIVNADVPEVTVDRLFTNNNQPTVTGTAFDDNDAGNGDQVDSMTVTVTGPFNSNTYTSTTTRLRSSPGASELDLNDGTTVWTLDMPTLLGAGTLADGAYEIVARAADNLGNEGTDLSALELYIDTVVPTITPLPLVTGDTTPILFGTISEPLESMTLTIDAVPSPGTWATRIP